MDRKARRARLVLHDTQWFAVARQAQHGFDKIAPFAAAARGSIETASADHKMPRAVGPHHEFAGQLAQTIDTEWSGRVRFPVGVAALPVQTENIIRAEVDQCAPKIAANEGKTPEGPGIHVEGDAWLALGTVDV